MYFCKKVVGYNLLCESSTQNDRIGSVMAPQLNIYTVLNYSSRIVNGDSFSLPMSQTKKSNLTSFKLSLGMGVSK